MYRLKIEQIELILMLLVEGNSLSAISRITQVSKTTVGSVLDKAGSACNRFFDENVRGLDLSNLQCDEMWSFVYAKSRRIERAKAAPAGAGDAWVWTALDRHTKLLASYHVGSRETQDALKLTMDLADRIDSDPQVFTDQHKPYLEAMEAAFGGRADYAQVGKRVVDGSTERVKRIIAGSPDLDMISTSHVERANLTWRMHNRRFIRSTNGFSKKLSRHEAMMNLFAVYYNFCRRHSTIRTTPAVAAGLDIIERDRNWLAMMVLEMYESPRRRGPYRSSTIKNKADRVVKTRGRSRAIRIDLSCPNRECGSHWLPKKGKSGDRQLYQCQDCGYNFGLPLEESVE